MKKAAVKLALHRETLRNLTEVEQAKLKMAVGGTWYSMHVGTTCEACIEN